MLQTSNIIQFGILNLEFVSDFEIRISDFTILLVRIRVGIIVMHWVRRER